MKNMMKETQTVVDVVASDGKFRGVSCPVEYEGETNIRKENEMTFCLREDPKYRISVVAVWSENARGDTVDSLHIYYHHILSGKICMNIWACRVGVVYNKWSEEKWDTLTARIMRLRPQDLRQIVCHEKKYSVHLI